MKLKTNVKNKIGKMNREELVNLIEELCQCNDDVVTYLNNVLTTTKLDVDKLLRQINRCFEGCNFKVDNAIDIYLTSRKTTKDYDALSRIGLLLLQGLIWDFDLGNYSRPKFNKIENITPLVLEDISKVSLNKEYRLVFEELMENECLYDMMQDCYYSYFDNRIDSGN